jgi:hypothetical protein
MPDTKVDRRDTEELIPRASEAGSNGYSDELEALRLEVEEEFRKEEEEEKEAKGIETPNYVYSSDSIIDASKVVTKQVDWLWYPYLPKSFLVMGEGESELGKTAVELDLIARMTTGRQLPDGSKVGPIGVVYVTFEDLPEYTIVPRLEKAGADLSKVRIIANVEERGTGVKRPLNIQFAPDLDLVRRAGNDVQAGYYVIDPVTSAFGGTGDIYKTTDVRKALAPLTEIARTTGATVKIIRHHKKGKSDSMSEQGIGSMAFYEVSRSVMGFYRDPEDETDETRLFVHKKSNLSEHAKARKYKLEGTRETVVAVKWLGESTLSNRQIMDGPGAAMGALRQGILALFSDEVKCQKTGLIVHEMVENQGYTEDNVYKTLTRMEGKQLYSPERGRYCLKTS